METAQLLSNTAMAASTAKMLVKKHSSSTLNDAVERYRNVGKACNAVTSPRTDSSGSFEKALDNHNAPEEVRIAMDAIRSFHDSHLGSDSVDAVLLALQLAMQQNSISKPAGFISAVILIVVGVACYFLKQK